MAITLFEVVPAFADADSLQTDVLVTGTGFTTADIQVLNFASDTDSVTVVSTGFTVDNDVQITIPAITFPSSGSYKLTAYGPGATVLDFLFGAVSVNSSSITFTLSDTVAVINDILTELRIVLAGITADQIGRVKFVGPAGATLNLDAFDVENPLTLHLRPVSFSVLGLYNLELFDNPSESNQFGSTQLGALEIVLPPNEGMIITGLNKTLLQPGDLGTGFIINGRNFTVDTISRVKLQRQDVILFFSAQASPFSPDSPVPAGKFRLLDDNRVALGSFTAALPGNYGVMFEKEFPVSSGNFFFLTSRANALTVRDTQRPGIRFTPAPQDTGGPVSVVVEPVLIDPITGLETNTVDVTAQIYFTIDGTRPRPSPSYAWPPKDANGAVLPNLHLVRPTAIFAIAVDGAGNISSPEFAFYNVGALKDRLSVDFEALDINFVRYGVTNAGILSERVKYNQFLNTTDPTTTIDVPGVALVAPGYSAAPSTLLRDQRRGIIDILHEAGFSLAEVLAPPIIQFVNEKRLRLKPGREIFSASPFPGNKGEITHYVLKRADEDISLDPIPPNGTYGVYLAPSLRGLSYLDRIIQLTSAPPARAIQQLAGTFIIAAGKVTPASISNITDPMLRPTKPAFTDPNIDNGSLPPRDIHWRELEIAMENAVALGAIENSTGDSGIRTGDPSVLIGVSDRPDRPRAFLPPSNHDDPLIEDPHVTAGTNVEGFTPHDFPPVGPMSTNLSTMVRVFGQGVRSETVTVQIPVSEPLTQTELQSIQEKEPALAQIVGPPAVVGQPTSITSTKTEQFQMAINGLVPDGSTVSWNMATGSVVVTGEKKGSLVFNFTSPILNSQSELPFGGGDAAVTFAPNVTPTGGGGGIQPFSVRFETAPGVLFQSAGSAITEVTMAWQGSPLMFPQPPSRIPLLTWTAPGGFLPGIAISTNLINNPLRVSYIGNAPAFASVESRVVAGDASRVLARSGEDLARKNLVSFSPAPPSGWNFLRSAKPTVEVVDATTGASIGAINVQMTDTTLTFQVPGGGLASVSGGLFTNNTGQRKGRPDRVFLGVDAGKQGVHPLVRVSNADVTTPTVSGVAFRKITVRVLRDVTTVTTVLPPLPVQVPRPPDPPATTVAHIPVLIPGGATLELDIQARSLIVTSPDQGGEASLEFRSLGGTYPSPGGYPSGAGYSPAIWASVALMRGNVIGAKGAAFGAVGGLQAAWTVPYYIDPSYNGSFPPEGYTVLKNGSPNDLKFGGFFTINWILRVPDGHGGLHALRTTPVVLPPVQTSCAIKTGQTLAPFLPNTVAFAEGGTLPPDATQVLAHQGDNLVAHGLVSGNFPPANINVQGAVIPVDLGDPGIVIKALVDGGKQEATVTAKGNKAIIQMPSSAGVGGPGSFTEVLQPLMNAGYRPFVYGNLSHTQTVNDFTLHTLTIQIGGTVQAKIAKTTTTLSPANISYTQPLSVVNATDTYQVQQIPVKELFVQDGQWKLEVAPDDAKKFSIRLFDRVKGLLSEEASLELQPQANVVIQGTTGDSVGQSYLEIHIRPRVTPPPTVTDIKFYVRINGVDSIGPV